MYYAEIKYCDIANGTGVRTSLFVSGCRHHCKGCFNSCTWSFDYGKLFDGEAQQQVLDSMKHSYVRGLTVLGGEPFEPENQKALLPFLRRFRAEYPQKDLWMFSGSTYEELKTTAHTAETDEILSLVDVLVDGPFIEEQRDITLKFRGSSNQRLIDVPRTLQSGQVVCLN